MEQKKRSETQQAKKVYMYKSPGGNAYQASYADLMSALQADPALVVARIDEGKWVTGQVFLEHGSRAFKMPGLTIGAPARAQKKTISLDSILVTTETIAPCPIDERLDIVTAECAFGMHHLKDMFAHPKATIGERSRATQKVFRAARKAVLDDLRREASLLGADAVIAVSVNYGDLAGLGASVMLITAVGTAVTVADCAKEN